MVKQDIKITKALNYDNNEFGTCFNLNIKGLNKIRENYEEINFSQFKKLLNYFKTIYSLPVIDIKEQEIEINFNMSKLLTGKTIVFLKSTGSILHYKSLIKKLLTDDVYKSFIINETMKKFEKQFENPALLKTFRNECYRLIL